MPNIPNREEVKDKDKQSRGIDIDTDKGKQTGIRRTEKEEVEHRVDEADEEAVKRFPGR